MRRTPTTSYEAAHAGFAWKIPEGSDVGGNVLDDRPRRRCRAGARVAGTTHSV